MATSEDVTRFIRDLLTAWGHTVRSVIIGPGSFTATEVDGVLYQGASEFLEEVYEIDWEECAEIVGYDPDVDPNVVSWDQAAEEMNIPIKDISAFRERKLAERIAKKKGKS